MSAEPAHTSASLDPTPPLTARSVETLAALPHLRRKRLVGRIGPDITEFLEKVSEKDLEEIPGSPYTWAELKWAFENESVVHLDDLLFRRVRLGHLLPEGGLKLREEIERRLSGCNRWSPQRWREEWDRYEGLWRSSYSPVPEATGTSGP